MTKTNSDRRDSYRELIDRVRNFLEDFEMVFSEDWEMTESCLQDDLRSSFIDRGGTFLDPGVNDESSNWWNRGALLTSYRDLSQYMEGLQ